MRQIYFQIFIYNYINVYEERYFKTRCQWQVFDFFLYMFHISVLRSIKSPTNLYFSETPLLELFENKKISYFWCIFHCYISFIKFFYFICGSQIWIYEIKITLFLYMFYISVFRSIKTQTNLYFSETFFLNFSKIKK